MKIECKKCGNKQTVNAKFIVTLIGAAMPVGGFWAWVTFFFAGTGLALPICIALVLGGTAMLAFKDEITDFIIKQGYSCPKCRSTDWKPINE